jgi:hypothetical protein
VYCRPSHRQRAYEARAAADRPDPQVGALDPFLDDLQHALADPESGGLAQAARALLMAAGRTVVGSTASERTSRSALGAERQRSPARSKPWKVLCHLVGTDASAGELYSAHTTEGAARSACRQLEALWRDHQFRSEAQRWCWSVVDDAGGVIAGPALDRQAARAAAAALRLRPQAGSPVRYRRFPDRRRANVIHVERLAGTSAEPLAARHHRSPALYYCDEYPATVRAVHPYLLDLLQDVCDFASKPTSELPRPVLHHHLEDFATEVLAPLGPDTWELDGAAVRAWLQHRGVVRILDTPAGT